MWWSAIPTTNLACRFIRGSDDGRRRGGVSREREDRLGTFSGAIEGRGTDAPLLDGITYLGSTGVPSPGVPIR